MKAATHLGFNFFFGLSLGFSPLGAAVMTAGGMLPDICDRFIALGSKTLWRSAHRTFSHWPWPYLGAALFLHGPLQIFLFGALLHCVLDALTPTGIPWVHPLGGKWKRGLGLIKTGSFLELGVIAGAFLLWQFTSSAA
ncbi:metal-dependent hydrolase [Desulfovermiculus halophilus]|jgi:membrane-bound metal-dependent hydrolase YbcI (DUF457 family)|uniref:metal-dependent hydrolase n=1 Tax=Desulfovermiculus halophilus TaxID=339722 RepID=UPI000686C843|nr:metal-dependent hydrolase [Desulfovermiculus halophilus]